MPFVALRNGERVTPYDVPTGATVQCPECGGDMSVRKKHHNQGLVPRHFAHKSKGDCNGESDIHKRMKTVARSFLEQEFPDATVDTEVGVGERIADVLCQFDPPRKPYGNGIIVEVQHKHKEKDMGHVTRTYYDHGFSVMWAYQSDFTTNELDFNTERFHPLWPDSMQHPGPREHYPDAELHDPSFATEVVFPDEYYDWHRIEYMSPSEARDGVLVGWSSSDSVWLHSKGREVAWFRRHTDPNNVTLLEFWRKHKPSNTVEYVPVVLGPDAYDKLSDAIGEFQHAVESGDAFESSTSWRGIAEARFRGGQYTRGRFVVRKPPSGKLQIAFERADVNGNSRTVYVKFRSGDHERLANVLDIIPKQ